MPFGALVFRRVIQRSSQIRNLPNYPAECTLSGRYLSGQGWISVLHGDGTMSVPKGG